MNNNIFELLNLFLNSQNTQTNSQQKSQAFSNYPPEASENNTHSQSNKIGNILSLFNGNNNPLSMLSSLLGEQNPLSNILGNKKEEGNPPSPKDEILL
ncbi:MAG: hypothetical protein E7379_02330 [Clostridiales bacterium]|nr:hypothetical protein [Clostridiales bacterium]